MKVNLEREKPKSQTWIIIISNFNINHAYYVINNIWSHFLMHFKSKMYILEHINVQCVVGLHNLIFLPISFCNLIEISNNKNYSKFNISPTSSPFFKKSTSINPTHQQPSKNTKNVSKFLYIYIFGSNEFLMKLCFNIW